MSKFTKGPWEVTKHLDVMKGARFIAPLSIMTKKDEVKWINEETKANARLIAAAPDMYELITGAMKPETFDYQLYWNQARALLARIDGKEERHE